ncbi:hypothetical protein GBF38_003100 [Nibea albiflora]|uniref:Uncharacterized protein n=1 Tax=Nibea albiflora TaxID=240163 RepID=A0ACB7FKA8_NIBAL|nr:hypothetical protein GBF38_003100 [Nibea albiflora]
MVLVPPTIHVPSDVATHSPSKVTTSHPSSTQERIGEEGKDEENAIVIMTVNVVLMKIFISLRYFDFDGYGDGGGGSDKDEDHCVGQGYHGMIRRRRMICLLRVWHRQTPTPPPHSKRISTGSPDPQAAVTDRRVRLIIQTAVLSTGEDFIYPGLNLAYQQHAAQVIAVIDPSALFYWLTFDKHSQLCSEEHMMTKLEVQQLRTEPSLQ